MATDAIQDLYELLRKDYASPTPKYPKLAIQTFKDERVIQALGKRFENKQVIIDIKSLEYNIFTGLSHVYFEFAPKPPLAMERDTFLVIIDQYSNVIGIVDPFNPDQPNRFLPALGNLQKTYGELPFVLERPSITQKPAFNIEQLKNNPTSSPKNVSNIGAPISDKSDIMYLYSKEFHDQISEMQKSMLPEERDERGRIYLRCGGEQEHGTSHGTNCPRDTWVTLPDGSRTFFHDTVTDACDSGGGGGEYIPDITPIPKYRPVPG